MDLEDLKSIRSAISTISWISIILILAAIYIGVNSHDDEVGATAFLAIVVIIFQFIITLLINRIVDKELNKKNQS